MILEHNNNIFIFQKGFNYSQDGPGNRLVYHLCGCNLHCPWCSNPEGLKLTEKAEGLTVDDIVKEAISCKMMFIDNGGVTLTGGEVTCQKTSILKLIKALKKNNINTCIETNASIEDCNELFEAVDYMIADFKSPSKEKLKSVTGAELDVIKRNLLFRAKLNKPLLIRIPLINGFNNSPDDATAFADFFEALQKESGNENLFFEILTYHEYGKEKYTKLGMSYDVSNGFVTESDVSFFANEIRKRHLKLINT